MRVKIRARIKRPEAEEIPITTEFIRLDSFLKFANACESGGMAKGVIGEELVKVNGVVCTQRGKKLRTGDTVELDGAVYKVTEGA